MIQFEQLRVNNFAVYRDARLKFSLSDERPLTVIRGENESGKTTLMRAFVWVLFGIEGLPHSAETHPVRPPWAGDERIRSSAELRFRLSAANRDMHYKLRRVADTLRGSNGVEYSEKSVELVRREGDEWYREDDGRLAALLNRHFRPELQEFYFIDADLTEEFVGGPEGRHDDRLMRERATAAIRSLLGLDAIRHTVNRVQDIKTEFDRQIGRRSRNQGVGALSSEMENKQSELQRAQGDLAQYEEKVAAAREAYRQQEARLDRDIGELQKAAEVREEEEGLREQIKKKSAQQQRLQGEMNELVTDDRIFATLMMPCLVEVVDKIAPAKDRGEIPPFEATVIPRLLERGTCLCGADLSADEERRRHLESAFEEVKSSQETGDYLDSVLTIARMQGNGMLRDRGRTWKDEVERVQKGLGEMDSAIAALEAQLDRVRNQRSAMEDSTAKLQELRKHRDALVDQLRSAESTRDAEASEVDRLQGEVRSLGEKIRTASRAEERTQEARQASQAATDVSNVLDTAHKAIERHQVKEVSAKMNETFRDAIEATEQSIFEEVGVVGAQSREGEYEIFAVQGGRRMDLAFANGASRRAIAVSFVLALSEQTGARVPLVADSLLNVLSGAVKRNIVEYLTGGKMIGQPIVFVTRDDVLNEEVLGLVKARAGESYTVTAQSQVGGQVVRAAPRTEEAQEIAVCACAVDEFCQVCERVGDQESGVLRKAEGA